MTNKTRIRRARRPLTAAALTLVAATSALGLAACGNNDSGTADLPDGVAARVGDTNITYKELDRVMEQSKASAKQQGQTFPAKDSEQYRQAQAQALQQLVNQKIVSTEARLCGTPCKVSPGEINTKLDEIVKAQFQGKRAELNKFIKQRAMTMGDARDQVASGIQQDKIRSNVTRGIRFTSADAKTYYEKNAAQFKVPAGRTASHILVKTEAEAKKIHDEATPQNFAELARKYSTDTGTKQSGGSLGQITKGTLVKEFEQVAFSLPEGKVSDPVKTQFGWHLILIDKITPARTIPFKEAEKQIMAQQLATQRDGKFQEWVKKTLEKWDKRTVYASNDLKPQTQPQVAPAPAPTPATP